MVREQYYVNLIITGNPGVGKHTIVNLLHEQNKSFEILDISKFAIEKNLGEQVEDGIEIDTGKLANEIKKIVLEKKFGIKDRLKATIKPSDSNPVQRIYLSLNITC